MGYDKLVRDKIPDKIRGNGEVPITRIASDEEYLERLREKLQEEVAEFLESGDVEELADILEVVHALGNVHDVDKVKLEEIRSRKAEERGGFTSRIILDDVRDQEF